MSRTITVSLPVADLTASKAFYTALGFVNNPQFTDDTAAFMVWSESINVMLLTYAKWRTFTTRPIPPNNIERGRAHCLVRFTRRRRCHEHIGLRHGGTADINPVQDHGFMYGRDFADPDGHVWGAMWMDMSAMPSS